jgi:hypothetical protein
MKYKIFWKYTGIGPTIGSLKTDYRLEQNFWINEFLRMFIGESAKYSL